MLHELHIFGPLPATVMQEALRGLAAEPFYDDSGRFDRFRSRPPRGVQDWRPDGVQNLLPDGVQNLLRDGVQIWNPDGARSWNPDGARSWNPDGAQNRDPDGVQSWRISGLGGAEDRRRLLGALLVPVREARATALLRKVGSEIRGAAFDLEGTLTDLEFVDALAERLGFGERMQVRTRASMTGRTSDFGHDYEERMAALRGVEVAVMEEVIGSMTLAAGVEALCRRLHAAAIPVAVISGGCSRLGEAVRRKIALRALYATVWEERDARFTGRAASPVVDPSGKRRALEDFARTIACSLETVTRTPAGPFETVAHTIARPIEDFVRTPSGALEDCTRTTACPIEGSTHTTETIVRTTAGPLETITPTTAHPLEDSTCTLTCPLENIAAAGDGANDLEMLSAAGTALLTHATARPAWPEILAALL